MQPQFPLARPASSEAGGFVRCVRRGDARYACFHVCSASKYSPQLTRTHQCEERRTWCRLYWRNRKLCDYNALAYLSSEIPRIGLPRRLTNPNQILTVLNFRTSWWIRLQNYIRALRHTRVIHLSVRVCRPHRHQHRAMRPCAYPSYQPGIIRVTFSNANERQVSFCELVWTLSNTGE
jgi:hypothetical protein